MWRVSLTHPSLASFLWGEFLLRIPCWLCFYVGSFSYTSPAAFIFMQGLSLTHHLLAFFFCFFFSGEFLLHIQCSFLFYLGNFSYKSRAGFIFYLGSFSYTSRAGLICMWGVSLTHPMPALILSGDFPGSYTSHGFIFIWGVSLTNSIV